MSKLVFVLSSPEQSLQPVEQVASGDVTVLIVADANALPYGTNVDDFLTYAHQRVELMKTSATARGVTLSTVVEWGAADEVAANYCVREGAQLLTG